MPKRNFHQLCDASVQRLKQQVYNLAWMVMYKLRPLLIRSGILRLRFGKLTLGHLLHKAAVSVVPPNVAGETTVTLRTGQRMLIPANYSARSYLIGYENETTDLFIRLVKPGMTVVDVGTHLGYYTLIASSIVDPGGRVYAFEPDPAIYPHLIRNLGMNNCKNVIPVKEAVSNRVDSMHLFCELPGGSSLYPLPTNSYSRKVAVSATTLDEFLLIKEKLTKVDIIKMDIEGGEIAALQGMRRLSEVAPLLRLIIEFSSAHVSSDDAAQRFFSELALNGFTSFYVIGKGLKRLSIPSEVGWLCRRAQFEVVNILCDKGKGDLK